MKKIIILAGPVIAYLICYIICGFRESILSQADVPVTAFFLLECFGYCVIGVLILAVAETIQKEKQDQKTKILCGVDILVPLIIWIFGIKTGTLYPNEPMNLFIYILFFWAGFCILL